MSGTSNELLQEAWIETRLATGFDLSGAGVFTMVQRHGRYQVFGTPEGFLIAMLCPGYHPVSKDR